MGQVVAAGVKITGAVHERSDGGVPGGEATAAGKDILLDAHVVAMIFYEKTGVDPCLGYAGVAVATGAGTIGARRSAWI
jgi:hypothetical protein